MDHVSHSFTIFLMLFFLKLAVSIQNLKYRPVLQNMDQFPLRIHDIFAVDRQKSEFIQIFFLDFQKKIIQNGSVRHLMLICHD